MKKNILFSVMFLISILATSNAEDCVRPNQPIQSKCYKSVTSEEQIDKDKRYIYIETTTKQVEIPCAGESQKQIDYQVALVQYDVCLKVEESEKNKNSFDYKSLPKYANIKLHKRICPFPNQPLNQSILSVTDSAGFGNGIEIKRYSDNSYAIFNAVGEYQGIGNIAIFDNAKAYGNFILKMSESIKSNNLENYKNLSEAANLSNSLGDSLKTSIDQWLSDENNCPVKKTFCPLNSEPNNKNECVCVQGFYGGTGKSFGTCIPQKQAWEDSGLFLYGDPNSHKALYGYKCNEGYSPNSTKSKCLLNNKDLESLVSSTQNNLSYKKEQEDKVVLEKNISNTSSEDLDKVRENEKKLLDTLLPTSTTNIIKDETVTLIQKLKNFFMNLFNLE